MLDVMKRINWAMIAALLFCVSVWIAVGWALYHGLTQVQ